MKKHTIAMRLAYRGRRAFTSFVSFEESRLEVAEATAGLLRNPGIQPLGRSEAARVRAYAREFFGSEGYAPWLEFYTLFRGAFHEGWIPDNFFQNIAVQRINGAHHRVDSSRSLMTRLVATPMLPDLAHLVSGEWRAISGEPIDPDRLESILFAEGDEVCVKTEDSHRGRGTSFVHRANFDPAALQGSGNLVVQSVIRQHPFFDALSPRAVATLRVTTGKVPGKTPFLIGTYLRLGLGASRAVGETSLKVGIVDADGTLADFASDPGWRRMATHPETGTAFAGLRIPSFRDLVARCFELHDRLPQLGLIGWDVIVDAAGEPRLMEINTGYPDMKFIEMTQGPTLQPFHIEDFARRAA